MNKSATYFASMFYIAALFVGATALAEEKDTGAVKTIEVNAARDFVAVHGDAVIVDVRTPAEFKLSHVTGALNVNVQDDDFATLAAALDKDKTYLVHCTKNPADGRSSRALETLQELGFKNLYSIEGGYVAWKEAELPLTEADPVADGVALD